MIKNVLYSQESLNYSIKRVLGQTMNVSCPIKNRGLFKHHGSKRLLEGGIAYVFSNRVQSFMCYVSSYITYKAV